jgi:hypothetical protein
VATQTRQQLHIADPPDGQESRGDLLPIKPSGDEQSEIKPHKRQFVPIKDYLNNIADHAASLGKSEALKERRRKTAKMRMLYEGDQIIRWNEERQVYVNKKRPGDALYIDPVLATFIDIITAQLSKSRSTLVVRPRNEERVDKQQAAKYATELIEDAASQLLNARNTQREIKYSFLLSGEAYRYTYFDRTVEGRGIEKPKYGVKVAKGSEKMWYCPDCHAHGKASDLIGPENPDVIPEAQDLKPTSDGGESVPIVMQKRCPECDFPKVETVGGREVSISIDEGGEYENIGDVNCEFIDPLEMTVIGARDHIADGLIVIRDRMIPRCVLESVYEGKELPSTGTPDNLRYKEAANSSGRDNKTDSGGTYEGGEAFEMLHFQELWVNPAVYHDYQSPRDETLANGENISGNEKLCPMMPTGAYYCRVGKTILDLYEQAIKDCWSHAVNSITGSFHGQGEWDLMPQQEQKNEVRSMQINGIMLDSFRPLMARNGAIDINQIPNKAGAVLKINNLQEGRPLSDALDRVPGGGSIPDAYLLDDKIAGGMQQRSGAFSSTTDLPDAKLLGTATGVTALAEHAVARRVPMLALRAQMEQEQGYQFLECRQKYWPEAMYESMDKKVGGDAGRWFRESNIRRDFIVEVVAESFLPTTATQDTENFNMLMSTVVPLSGGDPAVLRQMRQRAVELFGKGVDLDSYQLEKVEAATRLEKLKQIATFFETESGIPVVDQLGQPIAEMVANVLAETTKAIRMPHVSNTADVMMNPDDSKPDLFQYVPLDVLLDNHAEYSQIYTEWMKSSDGRESTLFVRTCVRTLIQKHQDAKLQKVINDKSEANLAQVPDLQAGLMANRVQSDQQREIGTADANEAAATAATHQIIGQTLGLVPPAGAEAPAK